MEDLHALEKKALKTISEYSIFERGERVIVAVSGGPDSTALLLFLHSKASMLGIELAVFHLDHMLRGGESRQDALFVEEFASRLGIEFILERRDVGAAIKSGSSPEDVARRIRLDLLHECAKRVGAGKIALGHTADDQVETFLMRAFKGAGLDGLASMKAVSGKIVRPLIRVWRSEVEDYLKVKCVKPRYDSSNLDVTFLRNRIRGRIIPYLEGEFGPSFKETILREIEALSADRDYMTERTLEAFGRNASVSGDTVRISADSFMKEHEAIKRRILRDAWHHVAPDSPPLLWAHVRDILDKVFHGETGARVELPEGILVEREYNEVVFRKKEICVSPTSVFLDEPGSVEVPGTDAVIDASIVELDRIRIGKERNTEYVRKDTSFPLEIRPVKPGDSFRPLGAPGMKKVSQFLIDAKVPKSERKKVRILLSGGDIVWVVGMRLDERFKLEPGDKEALRLRVIPKKQYYSKRID